MVSDKRVRLEVRSYSMAGSRTPKMTSGMMGRVLYAMLMVKFFTSHKWTP